MTKSEVEKLSRDAMNIPGPGTNRTIQNQEVSKDEVDQDANPETESHSNNMNYCPNCGMKLGVG